MSAAPSFTVLQFNTWLLNVLGYAYARDFQPRRRMIPEAVAAEGADVISLMEVWRNSDKRYLADRLRDLGYKHSFHTRHRFGMGDGLLLVSRHPILDVKLSNPFTQPTSFIELFARKRTLRALIDIPNAGPISFFQTHLGAVPFDPKKNSYDPLSRLRLRKQVHELVRFIREAQAPGTPLILAGDLNFHHEGEEYQTLLRALSDDEQDRLTNSFLHSNSPTPEGEVHTYSRGNPYVASGDWAGCPSEMLDHILYLSVKGLRAIESRIVFTRSLAPGPVHFLSDHYGVKSSFTLDHAR